MAPYSDTQEAQFHGSVDLLIRNNIHINQANEARNARDASWKKHLFSYYLELSPFFEEKEQQKAQELIKQANNETPNEGQLGGEAYAILWELEIFLRRAAHKHGIYAKLVEKEDMSLLE